MSGYLEYEAVLARNDGLRSEAAREGRPIGRIVRKPKRRPVLRSRPGGIVRGTRVA